MSELFSDSPPPKFGRSMSPPKSEGYGLSAYGLSILRVVESSPSYTLLQTQNEKIINLTQKRIERETLSLFVKSDFLSPKVTFESLCGSKSHFLVTFESLYKKAKKSL